MTVFKSMKDDLASWYLGTSFMKHFRIVFMNNSISSFAVYQKAEPQTSVADSIWDEIKHHSKAVGFGFTAFVVCVILVIVCICCCRKDNNSAVRMNKTLDIEPFNMDFDGYRPEDMTKHWVRKTQY